MSGILYVRTNCTAVDTESAAYYFCYLHCLPTSLLRYYRCPIYQLSLKQILYLLKRLLWKRRVTSTVRSRPGRPPPVAESPEPGTQALGLDVIGLLLGDLCRVPLPLLRLLLVATRRKETADKRTRSFKDRQRQVFSRQY